MPGTTLNYVKKCLALWLKQFTVHTKCYETYVEGQLRGFKECLARECLADEDLLREDIRQLYEDIEIAINDFFVSSRLLCDVDVQGALPFFPAVPLEVFFCLPSDSDSDSYFDDSDAYVDDAESGDPSLAVSVGSAVALEAVSESNSNKAREAVSIARETLLKFWKTLLDTVVAKLKKGDESREVARKEKFYVNVSAKTSVYSKWLDQPTTVLSRAIFHAGQYRAIEFSLLVTDYLGEKISVQDRKITHLVAQRYALRAFGENKSGYNIVPTFLLTMANLVKHQAVLLNDNQFTVHEKVTTMLFLSDTFLNDWSIFYKAAADILMGVSFVCTPTTRDSHSGVKQRAPSEVREMFFTIAALVKFEIGPKSLRCKAMSRAKLPSLWAREYHAMIADLPAVVESYRGAGTAAALDEGAGGAAASGALKK